MTSVNRTNRLRRSRRIKQIEAHYGVPLREVLLRLYHQEGLTMREVSLLLGVGLSTVGYWMAVERVTKAALAADALATEQAS